MLPVDLVSHEGERKLLALARRYRRPRTPVPGVDRKVSVYRVCVHLLALSAAAAGGRFGSTIKTNGFVPIKAVIALASGLGLIAGYVAGASIGAVLFTLLVPFVKLLLPRRRRANPAVAPSAGVGLAAAARITPIDATVFEGTLTDSSGTVSLASDLRGAIVGAEGRTIGADVADALVAPLVIEGAAGDTIEVHVEVGEVVFAESGREVRFGDGAPRAWGIARPARGSRTRRRFPPSEALTVWAAQPGTRVRIQGGVTGIEAVYDADGVLSDRTVVRGSAEAPVRVTVLSPVEPRTHAEFVA